jgi:hypothetical protein
MYTWGLQDTEQHLGICFCCLVMNSNNTTTTRNVLNISLYADALARALGERFWDPPDFDVLAERLLTSLENGLAKGDKRLRRVTATGIP